MKLFKGKLILSSMAIALALSVNVISASRILGAEQTDNLNENATIEVDRNTEGEESGLDIRDGFAHKIFDVNNDPESPNYIRAEDYSNEESDIYRFCVYVETDYDTDADGWNDLVKVFLQVPRLAVEGEYLAPVIFDPTPYNVGIVRMQYAKDLKYDANGFELKTLYAAGEKRVPCDEGSISSNELALNWTNANEEWNYFYYDPDYDEDILGYIYAQDYDYFLERGFAVAMCSGIGTRGSEGYELCGMDLERDAIACVVEWLAGKEDRNGFYIYTGEDGNIDFYKVDAEWSNKKIALTGTSYGGTLPFEVAMTGVDGLETIIPYSGIASWYNYTNSQGVPLHDNASYTDALAINNSAGCYTDETLTEHKQGYKDYLGKISELESEAAGNYTDIWKSMDYTRDVSKVNCSALIVQGLNDFNVTTVHADKMQQAFTEAGKTAKLVLHQGGHLSISNFMVNGRYWNEVVNEWLCYYLCGVNNDINDELPTVLYQDNYDDKWYSSDTWRDFNYRKFEYSTRLYDNTVESRNFGDYWDEAYNNTPIGQKMDVEEFYANIPVQYSTKYVIPFKNENNEQVTLLGVPKVNLDINTPAVERDRLMVTAVLIDVADDESEFDLFKIYNNPGDGVKTQLNGTYVVDDFEYAKQELVKEKGTHKCISYGWIDLDNPVCGNDSEISDYYAAGTTRDKDKYYSYTINMLPVAYTVAPNHHLELAILPWDPFKIYASQSNYGIKIEYQGGEYNDDELCNYSFTIDTDKTEIVLPLESKSKDIKFDEVNYNLLDIHMTQDQRKAINGEVAYTIKLYNEMYDKDHSSYFVEADKDDYFEYLINTDNEDIVAEFDDYDLKVTDDGLVLFLRKSFIDKFDEEALRNTKITFTVWDEDSYCSGAVDFYIDDGCLKYYTIPDEIYTGAAIKPIPVVYDSLTRLEAGKDFTYSYANNKNAGLASVAIKGKGNYSNTDTAAFNILAKPLGENLDYADDIYVAINDKVYNGKEQISKPKVTYGKITLKENRDYTLEYIGDKSNIGSVVVKITGKGNYSGTIQTSYKIYDKEFDFSGVYVEPISSFYYSGSPVILGSEYLKVYLNSDKQTLLKENVDYTVSYINNKDVGTATVVISGCGAYNLYGNAKRVKFKIVPDSLAEAVIAISGNSISENIIYTGKPLKPEIAVILDGKVVDPKDYKVSYSNNVKANGEKTPTITVTGKKNLKGKAVATFVILQKELTEDDVAVKIPMIKDTGTAISELNVKPLVKYGKATLKKGKDYTVKIKVSENNIDYLANISFSDNFKGNFDMPVRVCPSSGIKLDNSFAVDIDDAFYTGNEVRPKVTVTDTITGIKLAANAYSVEYSNNVKVSDTEPTVVVTGKGMYTGSIAAIFRICNENIARAYVEAIPSQSYTGSQVTISGNNIKVYSDSSKSTQLVENVDYVVDFGENVKTGKGTVIITGIGKYGGIKTEKFAIIPKLLKWTNKPVG